MSEKIFLIHKDGSLDEMNEELYESEILLQDLLEKYPNLIDGEQIDFQSPRKWVFITREKSVADSDAGNGRWSVDHLFVDQDGIPTIVEVKRSTDTRIRREVVGQMLEYAANAVSYWSIDELRNEYEKTSQRKNILPEAALQESLGIETDYDVFWELVKTNLKAGKVRLLFIADSIPPELRRIIEFLNEQMNQAEVLGLEIKQFTSGGLKTLVPKVIGQTAEALSLNKSGSLKRQWDEHSFFAEINARNGKEGEKTARAIYEWSKQQFSRIWFGQGKNNGSFVPIISHKDQDHQAFAMFTYGTIEIYFQWYLYKPPFDSLSKRQELQLKLNEINGVAIPDNKIDKRPNIPISVLKDQTSLKQFLSVFEWYIGEIRKV